jgi:hypothetical protein
LDAQKCQLNAELLHIFLTERILKLADCFTGLAAVPGFEAMLMVDSRRLNAAQRQVEASQQHGGHKDSWEAGGHKVHIYRVQQCMSPRRNWDSPTPSLASECAPSPGTKGGGGGGPHAAGGGGGGWGAA